MSPKKVQEQQKWTLASVALDDAYTDFILSRQAMQCTPATLAFYKFTAGVFLRWVEERGISSPDQIDARQVREYLAELTGKGKSDKTLHAHARAVRTLLRFWNAEGYLPTPVTFDMPRMAKKRLPCPTAEQLEQILKTCDVREKAIIKVMADSGLRRAELIALNWNDINIQSGLIRVKRGKGKKDRSAVIGATARRAVLAYRRKLGSPSPDSPMFQTQSGGRFTGSGLLQLFRRLSKKSGVQFSPHALRRAFATLALRDGMNVLHLQALGGWASLDMVEHYAQMVDDDLLQAHKAHSPMDNLGRLK